MVRRAILTLWLLLVGTTAYAQRPGAFTTVTTTDTTANSVLVGCAVGSTSCSGGLKAGSLALTGAATVGTTLGVTGATTLSSTLDVTGTATLGVVNASGLLTLSGAAPQITLNNGTSNWILWPAAGTGAPSTASRSLGSRLVLYPDFSAGVRADFAIGIESNAMWLGVPITTATFRRYGGTTLWETLDSTGLTLVNGLSFGGTFTGTGIITPATLATGNNNDYNPTGLSTAYMVRVTKGTGSVITGIAGGINGRKLLFCATNSTSVPFSNEDANSTAANRILLAGAGTSVLTCAEFVYDGTRARWMEIGGLK